MNIVNLRKSSFFISNEPTRPLSTIVILGEIAYHETSIFYRNIKQNVLRKTHSKQVLSPINVFEPWLTYVVNEMPGSFKSMNSKMPFGILLSRREWITPPTGFAITDPASTLSLMPYPDMQSNQHGYSFGLKIDFKSSAFR